MEVTNPVTATELRLRHAQLNGLLDTTVDAKAEDFERAIRIRFGITAADAETDAALKHAILVHFPWWLLWVDRVGLEVAGTATYTRSPKYDADWPAELASDLAEVIPGGFLPLRRPSTSTTNDITW